MDHLTYEALLLDPDMLNRVTRDARRERARIVGDLLSAAFRALFAARPRRAAPRQVLQTSGCR